MCFPEHSAHSIYNAADESRGIAAIFKRPRENNFPALLSDPSKLEKSPKGLMPVCSKAL
jgi:hypothetical protein